MAAGDAQRVWFQEMLEELKSTWSPSMTWEELTEFCSCMTEKRKNIRHTRGIRPPVFRCPKCGGTARQDNHDVSIRSALFALKKNAIVTDEEFKVLDKSWMKHKTANRLDSCGRKIELSESKAEENHVSCKERK